MFRKPSYCCNCGDKVERAEWRLWNSRRFCELCETEYVFDEWWPRVAVGLILIVGIAGFGSRFSEKKQTVLESENTRTIEASPRQVLKGKKTVQNPSALKESSVAGSEAETQNLKPAEQKAGQLRDKSERDQVPLHGTLEPEEEIFYCGAMTKKGTACARRVKGGGRCWQHKDRESPLDK